MKSVARIFKLECSYLTGTQGKGVSDKENFDFVTNEFVCLLSNATN